MTQLFAMGPYRITKNKASHDSWRVCTNQRLEDETQESQEATVVTTEAAASAFAHTCGDVSSGAVFNMFQPQCSKPAQ